MYFAATPNIAQYFYPARVWKIKDPDKNIYLTFDDGPEPHVTPEVTELLDRYNAKATFFCVGEKVVQNREIYNNLLKKGHAVGNHSFNHLNGKVTPYKDYLENVQQAAGVITSKLFRPPYGKISARQARTLSKSYKIVMWSVLPGDFDSELTREDVLKRAIHNTKKGSIIVFHDNIKFQDKMMFALQGFLRHFSEAGYQFKAISEKMI